MKKTTLFSAFTLLCTLQLSAQYKGVDIVKVNEARNTLPYHEITIPDVDGYKALKCDFHKHTIFSDGRLLPNEIVREEIQRGMDAIAITDHIGPMHSWIKADYNKPYELAAEAAKGSSLIVIRGGEVSTSKPFGHMNALFMTDVNVLNNADPVKAIEAAYAQGAFIMWNHPGWPNDTTTIYPVHADLIKRGIIKGIEVVNEFDYYPTTATIAKEHNLTYMGCTDSHNMVATAYADYDWAPMTIVFAKERSLASIKEALLAGRSVVKYGPLLIGSEKNLKSLVLACLTYQITSNNGTEVSVNVTNRSSIPFKISYGLQTVDIKPKSGIELRRIPLNGSIKVNNAQISDDKILEISLSSFN